MKSYSDVYYKEALTWFQQSDWEIAFELNFAQKKLKLSLLYQGEFVKDKTIKYDKKLVEEVQRSILNVYEGAKSLTPFPSPQGEG